MQLLLNLDVDDLDRAIAFYTSAFDLRVGRHFGDWAELVGGTSPIYLLPKAAGTPTAAVPEGAANAKHNQLRDYARHWTPLHLDFVVDDIELAIQRALKAGAAQEREITSHPYGRLALMADPFGHGFCLIQFTGRGYDELRTTSSNQ
ncbi:MAG: VOC family protein [Pseudomonadota bacterium]|nr:VOC family protein [Pseudomonadota bacterium]